MKLNIEKFYEKLDRSVEVALRAKDSARPNIIFYMDDSSAEDIIQAINEYVKSRSFNMVVKDITRIGTEDFGYKVKFDMNGRYVELCDESLYNEINKSKTILVLRNYEQDTALPEIKERIRSLCKDNILCNVFGTVDKRPDNLLLTVAFADSKKNSIKFDERNFFGTFKDIFD